MTDSNQTLFASVDGMAASLSNKECVFQHRQDGEVHVMTTDVLQAISLCREFQPLAQHVANIEQKIPALKGQSQAIGQVLEYLRKRDLLQSADDIFERLRTSSATPVDTRTVAIRTCDRPSELNRLLRSIEEYRQRFPADRSFVVFDDSRDGANQRANAELVAEAAGNGVQAKYCGLDWRNAVASAAQTDMNIDPAQVARLIGGVPAAPEFSGGQVWNAMLLATAGQGVFMLDDDFVLDFRQRQAARNVLSFATERERPVEFSANLELLTENLEQTNADVFSRAESMTGAGLGQLLAEPGAVDTSALRGMDWRVADNLLGNAVIKTTSVGTWGDPGMDSNLWFYLMPKEWLAEWWVGRERYFAQLRQPVITHCFDHLQVTQLNPMLPFSVDNGTLTPPATPVGRGEDLFFGMTLRYLYPNSVALNLPTMVGHRRPSSAPRDEEPRALTPSLSRLIAEYLLSRVDQCEAADPVARYRFLVGAIHDLAAADAGRRTVVLREFLSRIRADVVAQIQQTLASAPEAPAFFQSDAREWIEANGKALTNAGSLRLSDWPADLTTEDCATRLGDDLNALADSISVWPQLWQWGADRGDLLNLGR